MSVLRVLASLLVLPAFVVLAKDTALTEVADHRWCLDHGFAQTSTALSQDLCLDVTIPGRHTEVGSRALDRVLG